MMKTLCVAVVVLSLTSVCQPASLACEKLLKSPDNSPDLSGRWHYIAMSSYPCLVSTILNVFRPSAEVNITSNDTSNAYSANVNIKMYGHCLNISQPFFYENNTMFAVDNNNAQTSVLLQSGCPDCIVVKKEDDSNLLVLLSRRKSVTAAELKEFETQAECLGWSKPQVLSPDHDYENCKSFEDLIHDDADSKKIASMVLERLKNIRQSIIECDPISGISFYETATSQLEKMAGQ